MSYTLNFTAKTAIVTGGSRGIGKAISLKLQESGMRVAAIYASSDEAAKKFENEHGIKTIKADVSDFASCQQAIALAEDYFGSSIQVLINNAGITRDRMLHKQEEKGWVEVIKTNLISAINMSHCVIEKMRSNKYGRIVNISSINANGAAGQTNYSASKAGIEGFTKALALEGARLGITVNAIAPGYIETDMTQQMDPAILDKIKDKIPVGRFGTAEEIAAMATFLASNEAGFINGAVLAVNGGMRM